MKFKIEWMVILGLLIWITIQQCTTHEDLSQIIELQGKIKTREAAIHQLSDKARQERERRQQDSIIFVEVVDSVVRKSVSLESNIKRLRASPKIVEVVRLVPEVDTLFQHYDSLIQSQNFIIYSQEKQINQLYVDIDEVERNFQQRLDLQSQSLADQKEISDDLRKQLRKERRTSKLLKIALPVAVVGGFLLGQ